MFVSELLPSNQIMMSLCLDDYVIFYCWVYCLVTSRKRKSSFLMIIEADLGSFEKEKKRILPMCVNVSLMVCCTRSDCYQAIE